MDIVERLRSHWGGERIADVSIDVADAADEIEQLREALLDTVAFVSRADGLFLKKSTTDTLKGIPDGYR